VLHLRLCRPCSLSLTTGTIEFRAEFSLFSNVYITLDVWLIVIIINLFTFMFVTLQTTKTVWKVRGLTLLIRVGICVGAMTVSFSKYPTLANDALLTTHDLLLENVNGVVSSRTFQTARTYSAILIGVLLNDWNSNDGQRDEDHATTTTLPPPLQLGITVSASPCITAAHCRQFTNFSNGPHNYCLHFTTVYLMLLSTFHMFSAIFFRFCSSKCSLYSCATAQWTHVNR
jgi:hypothetical protein